MKILMLGKYYPPDRGGIETVLQSLCQGLVKNGHQVTVFCSRGPLSMGLNETPVEGVVVQRYETLATLFSQPISPKLFLAFLKHQKNYDIVHLHSPNPLLELSTLPISRERPLVVSWHSDIVRQKALSLFYLPIQKLVLNRCKSIVVATAALRNQSQIVSQFESKSRIIPYGIDSKFWDLKLLEKQKKNQTPVILFVGRLVPYKGVPVLLRALSKTHLPFQLWIVGTGPEESSLKQLSHSLGLAEKVTFLGSIPSETELRKLYHKSDFLVLPSISNAEAFGMVQLEAMAMGKPVITARLSTGISEVNRDGETGLHFRPLDAEDLQAKIEIFLSKPEMVSKMGQAARANFLSKYTLDKMISQIQELYSEILQ